MICTTLHHMHIQCTRSDRVISPEILTFAPLRIEYASSAHARIAFFPWKYCNVHHFASGAYQVCTLGSHYSQRNIPICATLHRVRIKCARPDRVLSREMHRFVQLRIECAECASSAHAWIALFPWKYGNLLHFASNAHPVHTLGSHFFPGNTSICTHLH